VIKCVNNHDKLKYTNDILLQLFSYVI